MTLRVLLAGQEAAGTQLLRALEESRHEVVGVLTQEPRSKGAPASLSGPAARAGFPVLPAELVRDPGFASSVRDWRVDLLVNAHSLHLIADEVLAAPRIGSFNLHPGPLPEYSGLNTVGWAIYNDETEYGVTVHWIEPRIDAGPIAFEERFALAPDATALSLIGDCTRRGVPLLLRLLEHAERDATSIPAQPQDIGSRRYFARDRLPLGGRVDWTRSAVEINRLWRAFDYGPFASPWGRPFMEVAGRRVDVVGLFRTGAPAEGPPGATRLCDDGALWVASRDEWIHVARASLDGTPVSAQAIVGASRGDPAALGGAA